jgi:hypothetical protein
MIFKKNSISPNIDGQRVSGDCKFYRNKKTISILFFILENQKMISKNDVPYPQAAEKC